MWNQQASRLGSSSSGLGSHPVEDQYSLTHTDSLSALLTLGLPAGSMQSFTIHYGGFLIVGDIHV